MRSIFVALAAALAVLSASAQEKYVWPEDPAVLEKLDRWQDLKFGVYSER